MKIETDAIRLNILKAQCRLSRDGFCRYMKLHFIPGRAIRSGIIVMCYGCIRCCVCFIDPWWRIKYIKTLQIHVKSPSLICLRMRRLLPLMLKARCPTLHFFCNLQRNSTLERCKFGKSHLHYISVISSLHIKHSSLIN